MNNNLTNQYYTKVSAINVEYIDSILDTNEDGIIDLIILKEGHKFYDFDLTATTVDLVKTRDDSTSFFTVKDELILKTKDSNYLTLDTNLLFLLTNRVGQTIVLGIYRNIIVGLCLTNIVLNNKVSEEFIYSGKASEFFTFFSGEIKNK